MIFEDGYIPDAVQALEVAGTDLLSDRQILLAEAKGFDDSGKIPPVMEWEAFWKYVQQVPAPEALEWWKGCSVTELFTPSQGMRPNCAGFAMANAALIRTLLQIANEFSEQDPKRFNPQGTWQASKRGSTRGGQTISAIAMAGNLIGNCLASDLGTYEDSQSFRELQEDERANAARHQIGVSLYDGPRSNVPEIIAALCRKGFTAIVGNCSAVQDGRTKDSNGVDVVSISGREWAHATCFGGWKQVNGTEYFFWVNSHDNIYPSNDGSPAFGGWMTFQTLKEFTQGEFFDLCAVVYSEADFRKDAPKTLNPWK